jgi:hypothetical protein
MADEHIEQLFAEIEDMVALCGGAIWYSHRAATAEDPFEHAQLRPDQGASPEWVELGADTAQIRLRFAGWTESLVFDGDPEDDTETCELALDFVAAALFGEMRVIELRLRGEVLRRILEVRVDGTWRRHSRAGKLGFAGARAWLRRDLERGIRSNDGLLARPDPLRDARPRGLAFAPWAGAGHSPGRGASEVAIDGELDLHNFSPKEVGALVREYIDVCHERGVRDLRIVHGKGKGVLRRTVHGLLAEHALVEFYRLGGHGEGSWGATIVRLRDS